jgi:hypothetical protein
VKALLLCVMRLIALLSTFGGGREIVDGGPNVEKRELMSKRSKVTFSVIIFR